MTRDLVSIGDLSDADVAALLDSAEAFAVDPRAHVSRRRDAVLATLFLEPSTRTRLSFEAAMLRLGGRVITSADAKSSSASKGESLSDTVRMVDGYADAIVLRHPLAGAARLAADVAKRPVVNAGDGGREHPTQTLVDLFTLRRRAGKLDGLHVVLWGDLRYGRTTHSLAEALVRFGARVLLLPEPGLEFPVGAIEGLAAVGADVVPVELRGVEALFQGGPPSGTLVGRGLGAAARADWAADPPDAIYVTRVQAERLPAGVSSIRRLPVVDLRFLAHRALARTALLHPLPRVGEIAPEVDADPRALYFAQAEAGIPVRMAILDRVLDEARGFGGETRRELGRPCGRPECITSADALPPFREPQGTCAFCGMR